LFYEHQTNLFRKAVFFSLCPFVTEQCFSLNYDKEPFCLCLCFCFFFLLSVVNKKNLQLTLLLCSLWDGKEDLEVQLTMIPRQNEMPKKSAASSLFLSLSFSLFISLSFPLYCISFSLFLSAGEKSERRQIKTFVGGGGGFSKGLVSLESLFGASVIRGILKAKK
jgi:hypothetical protein